MSTSPVTTPPKKPGLLWWIVGMLCAALAVAALGGLVIAAHFVKTLRAERAANRVAVSTPAGQIEVNRGKPPEMGLPVYPGADAIPSEGATIELTAEEGERVGIAAAHYRTSDPRETVVSWYRARLGSDFTQEGPGSYGHIHGMDVGRADAAFLSERGDLVRIVAIKKEHGGVEIALVRMGKQETQ